MQSSFSRTARRSLASIEFIIKIKKDMPRVLRGISFSFGLCSLVVAAATENYNYRKNYDPGAVIVKEIAKAVVIHMFPPNAFWVRPTIILCRGGQNRVIFFIGEKYILSKRLFGGVICLYILCAHRESDTFF